VAEGVLEVARIKEDLRGYRMTTSPRMLRHFTAGFQPL
jgi:tryptophanase